MSQAQAKCGEDPPVARRAGYDAVEWREALLQSYADRLANMRELEQFDSEGSLDRIRASFTVRMDELKLEIAEMKERKDNGG